MGRNTDTTLIERLSDLVLSHRRFCLTCFILLTLLLLSGLPNLSIDNTFESLFLESDPRLESLNDAIREYGAETGIVIAFRPTEVFDNEFLEGLSRYQIRNGLRVSGFVNRRTLAALSIPARERLAQLEANLARLKKLMRINKASS